MILFDLFYNFFKIGLFTFGGGYAMLPLIEETVLAHGWLSEADLVNFIAISESTPGPFAINISTYVGMETAGLLGAACATLGVVTPSFVIILIVARLYDSFRKNKIVAGCMSGLKPAVIGLIGAALIGVAKVVFFPAGFSLGAFSGAGIYISLGIFAVMTVAAFKKVHPIVIIFVSAIIGIAVGFIPGIAI